MRRPLSVAVLVAVVLAAGCATHAPFDEQSLDDVEAGLTDRGVTICDESTAEVDLPGAGTTTTYELAFDCDSDDEAFVAATEYENRPDRDGGAAQFAVEQTHGLNAVWTFGPYTIVLSGPRDDAVADAVTETLDDLDAR